MPGQRVDRLYRWLAELPTPEAEGILAAALEHAESPYAERIAGELFVRKTDAAWAGLIGNYPRLSTPQRLALASESELLRAGLARTLRVGSPRARCNALVALQEMPTPGVAYLLPDLLREHVGEVRSLAALALRSLAAGVVDTVPQDHWSEAQVEAYRKDRAEVARAVREALDVFDRHYRVEVIEAGLCLIADLGPALWPVLDNRHSQLSRIVADHLGSWESPRLARFLLEALGRPAWRGMARRILARWKRQAEVHAVLLQSDLLENTAVRQQLAALQPSAWLEELPLCLDMLPARARRDAPRWVCLLGCSEVEKTSALARCLHSGDVGVRRNAAYGLARVRHPDAAARLAEAPTGDPVLKSFVRWYLAGRRTPLAIGEEQPCAESSRQREAVASSATAARLQWRLTPVDRQPTYAPAVSGRDSAALPGRAREPAVVKAHLALAIERLKVEGVDPAVLAAQVAQIRGLIKELTEALGIGAGS